nr:MAG TPA: hypothetical protein [Caudoviricetes sp.]
MAIAHGLRDEGAWLRKRTLGSPYAIWMKIIRNCSMTVRPKPSLTVPWVSG